MRILQTSLKFISIFYLFELAWTAHLAFLAPSSSGVHWVWLVSYLGFPYMSKLLLLELLSAFFTYFLQLLWCAFSNVKFPIKIPSPSVLILPAKHIFYGCTLICCLGYPLAASLGKLIFCEAIILWKEKISSSNQQLIWISPVHMRLPQSTHVLYLPFCSLPISLESEQIFWGAYPAASGGVPTAQLCSLQSFWSNISSLLFFALFMWMPQSPFPSHTTLLI